MQATFSMFLASHILFSDIYLKYSDNPIKIGRFGVLLRQNSVVSPNYNLLQSVGELAAIVSDAR